MSTWTLEIDFDWPSDNETRAQWFERLLRECVDPLHRENVTVGRVRLTQKAEW